MKKFGIPIDGITVIRNVDFNEGIELLGQPRYGRFIFNEHDLIVENCTIKARPEDNYGIYIECINGALIQNCVVEISKEE